MREALFIKKNKDRWLKTQEKVSNDPDEMASDFTQLVDDLAYAKTFYSSSKVTSYINSQAARIYLDIYKNRKEEKNRLFLFWKYDLPLTLRKQYKPMFFASAVFVIFFVIGFFLSQQNEDVARSFLGDGYIEMTKENIRNGNPFGVYESGNPILSWLHIMINNIRYALIVFAGGIFAGLPTLNMLAETAAMVGTFDQFFASRGLGLQFFLVVFVHGTLELTAIIIAGGAGLVLAKSFLFPGTTRRLESLKNGAKDGAKIMIGLIPVFALAAFFEGLFTRLYNDIPALTAVITSVSVIFVFWYFILYPIRLGRRAGLRQSEEEL